MVDVLQISLHDYLPKHNIEALILKYMSSSNTNSVAKPAKFEKETFSSQRW